MSDTRSPPLANSLPPGPRPWLPDGNRDRSAAGEAWRSEAVPGQSSSSGRESRRAASRALPERTASQEALDRRARPAPLLRPQRQIGRKVALACALLFTGGVGGLVLGLSLRPGAPTPTQQQAQRAEPAAPILAAPSGASSAAPFSNPSQGGLPKSVVLGAGSDARPVSVVPSSGPGASPGAAADGDVEALRKNVAAEQARLESLTRQRSAEEAKLAQIQEQAAQREQASQREILARREAALASLPSVTAPLPSPSPRTPRAEPRTETAAVPGGHQRVVLHHRVGSYAATEAAGAMASQVREAGFDLSETRAVTATPSQRVVRYFHAEDAVAAARLAGRLGRGWALQDFRSYEPLPSPGLLEVWLPDR
jgi:hypothetical protein